MERIGLAASKMAKGNLLVYNAWVVLISFLFSLFIFIVAGSTVLFALIIFNYVAKETSVSLEQTWNSIIYVCFGTLTMAVLVFNLLAIAKNMKLSKDKH